MFSWETFNSDCLKEQSHGPNKRSNASQRKNEDSNQDDGEKLQKKEWLNSERCVCRDVINYFVKLLPLYCLIYFYILSSIRAFGLIQLNTKITNCSWHYFQTRKEQSDGTKCHENKPSHWTKNLQIKWQMYHQFYIIFLHVSQSYFTYFC